MAKVRSLQDLIEGYARMTRLVLGLEDQSIPTTNRPAYGNDEAIPLEPVPGWRTNSDTSGIPEYFPTLVAESRSDHTILSGVVIWRKGTSDRAVILPVGIAPLEDYEFLTHREDGSRIIIKATTAGFLMIPKGSTSAVVLNIRYPTPRGGG